jgi:hypothetical protein
MQRTNARVFSLTTVLIGAFFGFVHPAAAQTPEEAISSNEIVRRMVEQNAIRAEKLKGYTSTRNYTVTYKGFPKSLTAAMRIEVSYIAPAAKHFQVVSETGSKMLVDRVLKKLLESEEEAARNPEQTALTPANYSFTLVERVRLEGGQYYVLKVEPKVASKFLYRGQIWVDVQDFAVARIEAEPARNPSFLIKKTHIHYVYAKVGRFWLPELSRSETTVRMGGSALLSIEYGGYQVEPSSAQ